MGDGAPLLVFVSESASQEGTRAQPEVGAGSWSPAQSDPAEL